MGLPCPQCNVAIIIILWREISSQKHKLLLLWFHFNHWCCLVCVSGQASRGWNCGKENSFVRKVCFGLITAAVKPGANISLQRAGIEQNRKGRPTQIVIATIQITTTFGSILFVLHFFTAIFVQIEIKDTNATIFFKQLNSAEGSQVGLSNLFNRGR